MGSHEGLQQRFGTEESVLSGERSRRSLGPIFRGEPGKARSLVDWLVKGCRILYRSAPDSGTLCLSFFPYLRILQMSLIGHTSTMTLELCVMCNYSNRGVKLPRTRSCRVIIRSFVIWIFFSLLSKLLPLSTPIWWVGGEGRWQMGKKMS